MAKRYHINPETGDVNECKAKIKCDFAVDGVEPKHYINKKEANLDSEKMLAEKNGGSFGKILTREKTKDKESKFKKAVADTAEHVGYILSETAFTMRGGVEEMRDQVADFVLTEEQSRKRYERIKKRDYKIYLKEKAAEERKWQKIREEEAKNKNK